MIFGFTVTRAQPRAAVRLVDGSTLTGKLRRRGRRDLHLGEARLHQDHGEPVPLDGEVVIDRAKALWVQLP